MIDKPNIGIDIRWMVGNYRGMGRYAHELIKAVRDSTVALCPEAVKSELEPCIAKGASFFPWWEQIVLPQLVRDNDLKLLICPYNTAPINKPKNTQLLLVVHDLIFLRSWRELPPSISLYQTLGRLYRRWVVPKVIKNADILLTVSEYTKQEMIQQFAIAPERIRVIPNSIGVDWTEQPIPRFEERKQYLLSVAGEAPSKNVRRLIEAFAKACSSLPEKYILKIAGIKQVHHESFNKIAAQFGISERIEFIGFVKEDALRELYLNARGFVFASLFEGFGIPLLEAMASGTPIACSNTTSMPEVVAGHAYLFDPLDEVSIADTIVKLVDNPTDSHNMSLKAKEHVRSFSHANIEQQFIQFWKDINVQ